MRVRAWLVAALLLNLVGSIAGLVTSEYTDERLPNLVRLALLVASVACLVVFGVQWWRRRAEAGSGR